MKEKLLMSEKQMITTIRKMAKNIVTSADSGQGIHLVGIRTRGVPLARLLAREIAKKVGQTPKVGMLDINLYRDDLSEVSDQPIVHVTDIPFRIDGTGVVLVDDVLYTGRTIRAAMDALIDFGRPKFIKLAVFVDRGWRELPIQADFVGKKIKTKAHEVVKVMFEETDQINKVQIKREASKRA